jgi:hypothetical protein
MWSIRWTVFYVSQILIIEGLVFLPIWVGYESAGSLMIWWIKREEGSMVAQWTFRTIDSDYLWFQKPPSTCQAVLLVCDGAMVVSGGRELWFLPIHLQSQDKSQLLNVCLRFMSFPGSVHLQQWGPAWRGRNCSRSQSCWLCLWDAKGSEVKASWWLQKPNGLWNSWQLDKSLEQQKNKDNQWLG